MIRQRPVAYPAAASNHRSAVWNRSRHSTLDCTTESRHNSPQHAIPEMSSSQPRRLIHNLCLAAAMLGTIALGGAALWMTRNDGVVADVPLVPEIPAPFLKVRCFGAEQTFAFHANAPFSYVDESLRPRLGDSISETTAHGRLGDTKMPLYRPPEIVLDGTRLRGQWAAYRQLSTLSEVMGHPVSGIVGVDAVEKYVVELDLVGERLRLLSRVPPRVIEQSERLELRRTNRGWVVTGEVADGEPAEFSFNTSTNGGITLSQPLFDRLWAAGAVNECTEIHFLSPEGRGASHNGLLQRIALGRFVHTDLGVAQTNTSTLGCEYLRRYILVFDYPGRQLYLRPSPEFGWPRRKGDRSGLWILRRGDETFVYDCLPDSPASEAGFEKDDRLLQVDGDPVDKLSLQAVRERLNKEGETVEITAGRGNETSTRKFTLRDYWKKIPPPTAEK